MGGIVAQTQDFGLGTMLLPGFGAKAFGEPHRSDMFRRARSGFTQLMQLS